MWNQIDSGNNEKANILNLAELLGIVLNFNQTVDGTITP